MKKISIILFLLLVIVVPSFSAEKKFTSSYISDGIINYNNGNYIEAILNLRMAEQLSPNPVNVYKYLGMAYSRMSLWPQAVKEFNKILYVTPSDLDRAKILEKIKEWEAETQSTSALAQYSFYSIKYKNKIYSEPNNLLNYLALTEVYKCSGRFLEAESFFRALIKDRPDRVIFKKYLADVLYLDGKYAEAAALYRQILDVEPLNTDAMLGLNLTIKKWVTNSIKKNPENMANHVKLARVLKDLKRYEESIAEYDKFLQTDSANEEVKRERDETEKIYEVVVAVEAPNIN